MSIENQKPLYAEENNKKEGIKEGMINGPEIVEEMAYLEDESGNKQEKIGIAKKIYEQKSRECEERAIKQIANRIKEELSEEELKTLKENFEILLFEFYSEEEIVKTDFSKKIKNLILGNEIILVKRNFGSLILALNEDKQA
jgi:hypothetical protein